MNIMLMTNEHLLKLIIDAFFYCVAENLITKSAGPVAKE